VADRLTTTIDKTPRLFRVAAHAAINTMSRVLDPMRRRREGFGMAGDHLARVARTLSMFAVGVDSAGPLPSAPSVIELGPGRTPHIAAAFALCGAGLVSCFDTACLLDHGAATAAHYKSLAEDLVNGKSAPFRIALGAENASVLARARSAKPLAVTFRSYDGQHIPLPSGEADLLVSASVLEHVRRSALSGLLAELWRVLRPGAVMVHRIDLRDHMRIAGEIEVDGDWLDGLRYSNREYEAMFSHRPVYMNRLRASQWRLAFEQAGFEVVRWDPLRLALPSQFDRERLASPWRDFSNDELEVALLECTLRKFDNR
jgi:SAM-dependent methyltransferase